MFVLSKIHESDGAFILIHFSSKQMRLLVLLPSLHPAQNVLIELKKHKGYNYYLSFVKHNIPVLAKGMHQIAMYPVQLLCSNFGSLRNRPLELSIIICTIVLKIDQVFLGLMNLKQNFFHNLQIRCISSLNILKKFKPSIDKIEMTVARWNIGTNACFFVMINHKVRICRKAMILSLS